MARIRSVGGIATVQGRFSNRAAREAAYADGLQINVRLFAKTDVGLLAIDPRPQTYLTAIHRDAFRGGQAQAFDGLDRAPEFLHPDADDRTQGPWDGVIEDLQRTFNIETDAETLQALDFELLMDAELQRALDGLRGE
jgi:hypothetical protein